MDYVGSLYHVGVRVVELDAAMTELGEAFGITWASVVEREQPAWTPADGAFTTPLRFTYSCEGPQHVELVQGAPGSPWDDTDVPGVHHHGVWVDDVAAETARLVRRLDAGDGAAGSGGRLWRNNLRSFSVRLPPRAGDLGAPAAIRALVGGWPVCLSRPGL